MVRKSDKYYIEQLKSNPSDEIIEEVLSYVGENYEKFKYMTFVDFRKHIILVFKEKCKL